MLFIDASVLVAILTEETDADDLMDRLEKHDGPYYVSAVVRMRQSFRSRDVWPGPECRAPCNSGPLAT